MTDDNPDTVKQCITCPWKVGCQPMEDIPNFVPEKHHKLRNTIAEPGSLRVLADKTMHVMACHYSKPGAEFACAGWLSNQLGPGNNIGVRLRVMTGQMPVLIVDGPQYETFEETLCNVPAPGETSKALSTSSKRTTSTRSGRRATAASSARGPSAKTASKSRTKPRRV